MRTATLRAVRIEDERELEKGAPSHSQPVRPLLRHAAPMILTAHMHKQAAHVMHPGCGTTLVLTVLRQDGHWWAGRGEGGGGAWSRAARASPSTFCS